MTTNYPTNTAAINPYDYPDSWLHIVLAGVPSPGLCVECAGSNPRKFDERAGTGLSGATLVYHGDGIAHFSAKIQLGWIDDGTRFSTPQQQFAEWDEFKKLLKPPTSAKPNALDIFYPNLYLLPVPITSVQVEDVIGPTKTEDGSIWEWEIKFVQYRKPKVASSKAASSTANSNAPVATSPLEQEALDISAQVQAQAAKLMRP
jgi:hypothetical protein